jgi:hypothetical protein
MSYIINRYELAKAIGHLTRKGDNERVLLLERIERVQNNLTPSEYIRNLFVKKIPARLVNNFLDQCISAVAGKVVTRLTLKEDDSFFSKIYNRLVKHKVFELASKNAKSAKVYTIAIVRNVFA